MAGLGLGPGIGLGYEAWLRSNGWLLAEQLVVRVVDIN